MEATIYEKDNDYLSTDDVATLLVRLYADYRYYASDSENKDYARAVGIAIRMLTD